MNLTHIEDYIYQLYRKIDILSPTDLNTFVVAFKLGVKITYRKRLFVYRNEIILKQESLEKQWQMFGHEICHHLRHVGNQLNMPKLFVDYQEYQADYFAYHFCVPTFMLQQLKEVTVYDVMRLFNVEYDFALRRIEMYKSKVTMIGSEDVEGKTIKRSC